MLGDEILLEEYPFRLIARIELKTDKYGIPIEYHPAKRYENRRKMIFKIVYQCNECHEVVRTHERDDLREDVLVLMPWPCKSCRKSQAVDGTDEES